jgi:hypothetical protein
MKWSDFGVASLIPQTHYLTAIGSNPEKLGRWVQVVKTLDS